MSEIDARALRDALGAYPTGVTVVTTFADDGTPVGFTANSFSSVSLDPPLLLVCPSRALSSFAVFAGCAGFAVNVLAEGQEDISNTFAGFQGDRFARVNWHLDAVGLPLIEGAAASFSCATAEVIQAGDHIVLIGNVKSFAHSAARGLGYVAGAYFSLGLERQAADAPRPGRRALAGAIVEHEDRVLLRETEAGLCPPEIVLSDRARIRVALREHLEELGLIVTLHAVYSVFDNPEAGEFLTFFRASAPAHVPVSGHIWLPIVELSNVTAPNAATRQMLHRFALEHQTQSFGLYIGDTAEGDVHTSNEGVHR